MSTLRFDHVELKRSKYAKEPLGKEGLYLSVYFKDKESGEKFCWNPTYTRLRSILGWLSALHGEEEVSERTGNYTSFMDIYEERIKINIERLSK